MSVYTISPDLLRNIEKKESNYLSDILFVFCNNSKPFRVASDKKRLVVNIYASIERNREIIATWLFLMSNNNPQFEHIDVDLSNIKCEETMFFKLCKEIHGSNKIIFYSKQNIKKFEFKNDKVTFEDKELITLDRDEAKFELNMEKSKEGGVHFHGQVVFNGGQHQFGDNNTQNNYLKDDKEYMALKKEVDELNEFQIEDVNWKAGVTDLLNQLHELGNIEDKEVQKKAKGLFSKWFSTLKNIKDGVQILALPAIASDYTTKMIDLGKHIKAFLELHLK